MGFVVRLLVVFGKFAITAIVVVALLIATVWLLNKLTQITADLLGIEVEDFFDWLRSKFPKKNKTTKKETE